VDTPERLLGAPADDYVRDFVGFDRGIRRLSFFPAVGLDLATDTVLPSTTSYVDAVAAAKLAGEPWLLVVDSERRPMGWAAAADLESGAPDAALATADLSPVGHTFRPDTDSLRAALDATILSRTERAVGVDDRGQVLGTTSYERLRDAISAAEESADKDAAQFGRAS
jgi:osmoprotectant transport system ATP-binding protein